MNEKSSDTEIITNFFILFYFFMKMVGRVGFSQVGPGQVCAQPRTDPTPSSGKSEDLLSTELVIRSFRIEL